MLMRGDMMEDKFSFYFQTNNALFNSPVISMCYKADITEIKKYGLTGENILVLFCHKKLTELTSKKDINYYTEIKKLFKGKEIFLRIQSECLLGVYGDLHCDCEKQRLNAINKLSINDGIFIHLPQEGQGWGLHYKLKELELQVSGHDSTGKYVGIKNRDEAQKLLIGNNDFNDFRSYGIIKKILSSLGLLKEKYILISESSRKRKELLDIGLDVITYSDYKDSNVNPDNLSEYLVKILNDSHSYNSDIINKVVDLIEERKYNGRALSTLTSIIDKIRHDKSYELDEPTKNKFINAFEKIICGDEKRYIVDDSIIKIQNNYSCKVNSSVFKAIYNVCGKNVFDRVSLEKLYYFENKLENKSVRIRTSKILDTIEEKSIFLKGQIHVEQRTFNDKKTQIFQNEISLSKLRSFFENNNYDYVKRVEMITIISERQIPGVNVYIKKIPNIDSRIMDVYGKKEDIRKFITKLSKTLNRNVFNKLISNADYEDENFTNYNLRFADLEVAIQEELEIYKLLNKGDEENGV